MRRHRPERLGTHRLAAYLEGEVTASDAAQVAEVLECDVLAQRHLEQLKQIRDALSAPCEVDSIDLVSRVEACLAQPVSSGRAPLERALSGVWRRVARGLLPLGAAAAVLAIALLSFERSSFERSPVERSPVERSPVETAPVERSSTPEPGELRSKAAAVGSSEARRWAGIQVWRLTAGDAPERVHETNSEELEPRRGEVGASDRFVFSYTNGGGEPFGYLMIFGVDPSGRVYWFYPSYERAGSNPASIRIEAGAVEVALPSAIEHDLSAGPLEVHGLFSRRPLHVDAVEHWLGRRAGNEAGKAATGQAARGVTSGLEDIPGGADAFLQVLRVWVAP